MNIYDFLIQNPQIHQLLIDTFHLSPKRAPPTINSDFRKIFESFGFDYHKKGYSPKEITWRIEHNDFLDHICIVCGKLHNRFMGYKNGFARCCCNKCAKNDPETFRKRKETCLIQYGVENTFQRVDLVQAGMMRNQGVIHPSYMLDFHHKLINAWSNKTEKELKIIDKKRKATTLVETGYEHCNQNPITQEKRKATCREKYGVEHPNKLPEQLQKSIDTKIEKYGKTSSEMMLDGMRTKYQKLYGVNSFMQVPDLFDEHIRNAQSSRMKLYTFPSGNSYYVQGYEPKAIDLLLEQGYKEEDLLLKNRPAIKYFWSSEDGYGDDKWHYYHPDIIIPKENRIIEVKSQWTYDGHPHWYSKNLAKQSGAIKSGYTLDFLILK
jgi:hypothetical protein